MNRKKRPFWLLVINLLSLVGLIYLIFSFPPSYELQITNYKLPITPVFLLLLFSFLFFLASYLSRSFRRGALIGFLVVIYLIFRMLDLNSPYFLLLLIALFLSLELFFKKRI